MSNWRQIILEKFTPQLSHVTLVSDPDRLLDEEGLISALGSIGFALERYDDNISFRYVYESRYRTRWDRDEHVELIVLSRLCQSDLATLPFDLLAEARRINLCLMEIFPTLSYAVVTQLDRKDYDILHDAICLYAPEPLGENATKDFVLRHVYGVAPELIRQPSDLLRVLLRRHYGGQQLASILETRLVQLIRSNALFNEWPLESIVQDSATFFAFLQTKWTEFVNRKISEAGSQGEQNTQLSNSPALHGLSLPFEHDDIRVYIDDLFTEGLLKPVSVGSAECLLGTWTEVGIATDSEDLRRQRLSRLVKKLEESLPKSEAHHSEWFHYARRWAELVMQTRGDINRVKDDAVANILELRLRLDDTFQEWVSRRYSGLASLPCHPPVMLHHIPRFLLSDLAEGVSDRVALIVVDGLALDQWLLLKGIISRQHNTLQFKESEVFGWLPSITSVSRQAMFAGKPPRYFPASIFTTGRERTFWTQFWVDNDVGQDQVVFEKGLGDETETDLRDKLSRERTKVVGLVVDKVDKIMHGTELGLAGMYNQLELWGNHGYLGDLISLLLEHGYSLYLTSDHGNIEASGCGCPREGAIAHTRGERVRVYPDAVLRSSVAADYQKAIEWNSSGLPETYFALLAPNRDAFVHSGRRIVTHGGATIEELILPFVRISSTHAK